MLSHRTMHLVDLATRPDLWPDPNPWMDPEETLILLTAVLQSPRRRVLEIGTNRGRTARNLLRVVEAEGGLLVTVDVMSPPATMLLQQRSEVLDVSLVGQEIPFSAFMRGLVELVLIDPKERLEDSGAARAAPYDVIFVDGDHSYAGVSRDFEACRTLLRPGGLLLFHDVWWNVIPAPVDGPLRLLSERNGAVINETHIGTIDLEAS